MSESVPISEPSLVPKKTTGRPKGAGGNNVVKAGKIIEVIQPTEQANEADPVPISLTAARLLMAKPGGQGPRVYTPEAKAHQLANLKAGREKRTAMIALAKAELEKAKEANKPPEIVIKKYIIKPNQFLKRKRLEIEQEKQKTPADLPEDSSNVETEDFTGADTDMEMYKKIKRQERLLKKIKQVKNRIEPEAVKPVPVKPTIRMYNPFY